MFILVLNYIHIFHTVNDIYSSQQSISSKEIKSHIEYLLQINEVKKVVIFMDNAKTHTSLEMESFYSVFFSRYSSLYNCGSITFNPHCISSALCSKRPKRLSSGTISSLFITGINLFPNT